MSSNVLKIMRQAHARKNSVSTTRPLRVVSSSGALVIGTDALATAIAVMASDEVRNFGRLARKAAKLSTRTASDLRKASKAVADLEALEPMYAVGGGMPDYLKRYAKALDVQEEAIRARDSAALSAAYATSAHDAWSPYVLMPSAEDSSAYATPTAYAHAAKAVRTRRVVVSMPSDSRLVVTGIPAALGGRSATQALADSYSLTRHDRDPLARGIAARIERAVIAEGDAAWVRHAAYAEGVPIGSPRMTATLRALGVDVAEVAYAAPRMELEWSSDATRDVLSALRRELLKRSPLALRRASSPSATPNLIDADERQSMRSVRSRNSRNGLERAAIRVARNRRDLP